MSRETDTDLSELPPEWLDALAERIARKMAGIVPERVYSPEEAAHLLGMHADTASKRLKELPPEVLPTVPTSPKGKLKGYYGRDLIRYIHSRRDPRGPELDAA